MLYFCYGLHDQKKRFQKVQNMGYYSRLVLCCQKVHLRLVVLQGPVEFKRVFTYYEIKRHMRVLSYDIRMYFSTWAPVCPGSPGFPVKPVEPCNETEFM